MFTVNCINKYAGVTELQEGGWNLSPSNLPIAGHGAFKGLVSSIFNSLYLPNPYRYWTSSFWWMQANISAMPPVKFINKYAGVTELQDGGWKLSPSNIAPNVIPIYSAYSWTWGIPRPGIIHIQTALSSQSLQILDHFLLVHAGPYISYVSHKIQ